MRKLDKLVYGSLAICLFAVGIYICVWLNPFSLTNSPELPKLQAVNEPNTDDANKPCIAIEISIDIDPNMVKDFAEEHKLCDDYTDVRFTFCDVERDFTLEEFTVLLGFDLNGKKDKMIFERRVACMGFIDMNMKKITTAKLNDGRIVEYNACADSPDAYDPNSFEFIGKGIIHTVNGVVQSGDQQQCFFVKLF